MKIALPLLLILLAGCDRIPADPDGTLERVRAEQSFKVGLIASAELRPVEEEMFLNRVAQATGARPELSHGPSELMLARLEDGQLDLVLGELHPRSPWGKQVALIRPLREETAGGEHRHHVVAAKNGENAWIGLLDREARAVAAQ